MEPKKLAIVAVTIAIVIIGLTIGVSLFAFQGSENPNTDTPLTGITEDRDLLELGLQVPDSWSFAMSDGTTLSLVDLRGTIILVDLMATWCSACSTQNTYLDTVYESLAGSLVIISLSVDVSETPSILDDYKTTKGLPWDHGLDSNSTFSTYFGVTYIPSMVLIDVDGYFRFFHVGLWNAASISDRVVDIM
ncbi:MAG: TlpA family protein disulfide reductase [Candidatus Odinarchaeota archaeon]